jgi:hypothetical protein
MKRTNRLPFIKALPLLTVFTIGALFLVCILCINESKSFLPAFASYIDSGSSLFFPDLPRLDLLWFVPRELQLIPLTLGNGIDVVIFINIGLILNKIPYDCYRRASESHLQFQIVDLHLDKLNAKQKTGNVITGKCNMPCIDARAVLGSTVKHETELVNENVHSEKIGTWISRSRLCRISRGATRSCKMPMLARLAILASHIITISFSVEGFTGSGSHFSAISLLHAFFQVNGAYPS